MNKKTPMEDQRRAAQRRSGDKGDQITTRSSLHGVAGSSRGRPETSRRLRARIGFHSFLELRYRLCERLGERNLLCVIVVRTQPLAENLANAAIRRAVEQCRVIRCHGAFLRRAGGPVECIGGPKLVDRPRPRPSSDVF